MVFIYIKQSIDSDSFKLFLRWSVPPPRILVRKAISLLLSHIDTSVERSSSVVDSACDAHQNSSDSIPPRVGFLLATLPESSLQETSIDLQSALTLLLSGMDKMESNIANVTKTNNLLEEKITR